MTVIGEAFVAISPETASFAAQLQSKFAALNLGGVGAIAGGALAAGALVGLIKIGKQFDAVNQQIQKETGRTGDALAHTFDTVKDVFADVPDSLGKVTTAVDELARRGVPLGQTFDELTKQELALAHITGTDLASNVEQTTGLFKKYGVSLREQPELMDALFKATQQSGKALGDILGPLAANSSALKAFGFSMAESIAIVGNLGSSGIDANKALTSLRIAFVKITDAGKDPTKVFAQLNKEFASKNPQAFNDAIKVLGKRGFELANAMKEGKFNFDRFLKSITDGKNGLIDTEVATRTLGEQIAVMAHGAILAVQPLASSLTKGISQALTDLSGPLAELAQGAGHLVTALAPIGAVLGGTILVAFRVALPLLGAFGRGLDTIGQALDLLPPPLFIAIAAAVGIAALGFEGLGTAIVTVGVAIDIATGPIGLMLGAITLLGAAMGVFGKHSREAKIDTADLEGIFATTADSASSLSDSVKGAAGATEDWLRKTLAVGSAGASGVDTVNALGFSFAGIAQSLTGSDAQFHRFEGNVESAASAAGIATKDYDRFHDTLIAGRHQLELNAAGSIAAAQASGLLSDKQVEAGRATFRNKGFNDDYGKSIVDNVALLQQLTPAIEKASAARNAAAAKVSAPLIGDLTAQFATGAISTQALTDKLVAMGFTADGAKVKVDSITKTVQSFGAAIDKAFPSVSAAAEGLKNDMSKVVLDFGTRRDEFIAQTAQLRAGGGGNIDALRASMSANFAGMTNDLHALGANNDLGKFTENLKNQAVNISTFFSNLEKLVREGNGALARDLLDLGVQGGSTLAAGFASDKSKADAANAAAKQVGHIKAAVRNSALADIPGFEGIGKQLAEATGRGAAKADIAGALKGQAGKVRGAVEHVAAQANSAAKFNFTRPATEALSETAAAIAKNNTIARAVAQTAREATSAAKGQFDLAPPVKSGLASAARTVAGDHALANAAGNNAKGAVQSFGRSLSGLREQAASKMSEAASGATSGAGRLAATMSGIGSNAGNDFGQGLVNGIAAKGGAVYSAAHQLALQAVKAVRDTHATASPSKVAIGLGREFAAGLALGVTAGQSAVSDAASSMAELLIQQNRTVIAGFNDVSSVNTSIATLQALIAQLGTTSSSTTGTLSKAAEAAQQLLQTIISAAPSASSVLSSFLSNQGSALSALTDATATFHKQQSVVERDSERLAAATARTSFAFGVAIDVKRKLDFAIAAKFPTDAIDSLTNSWQTASKIFRNSAAEYTRLGRVVKEQSASLRQANADLQAAQSAAAAASDPKAFTESLNKQTAAAKRFAGDILKLDKEGFHQLAGDLASQGVEAAGKLATAFASDKHAAKLANAAVKSAGAYADHFTDTMTKLFGDPSATNAASAAGSSLGGAVGAAVGDGAAGAVDNSIATIIEKLRRVNLVTSQVRVDSTQIAALQNQPPIPLDMVPRVEPVTVPVVSVTVVPHVSSLGSLPPLTVAVTPSLGKLPALPPLPVEVVPHLEALPAPEALSVDVTPRVGPLPSFAATFVDVTPRLGELGPVELNIEPHVPALPPFPPMVVAVLPELGELAPLTVEVDPEVAPLPDFAPLFVDVIPRLGPLDAIAAVDVELLTPDSIAVDVTPRLLPIPTPDPIVVDVVPRLLASSALATATAAPAVPTAGGGVQTLDLDLTIVLEDGRVVNVTKTLPLPDVGSGKQAVKTEIHAS